MMAWVGRELGLCLFPPLRLVRGDLDLPRVPMAAHSGSGLARSAIPLCPHRHSVLAPRLPVGWRPLGGLAEVGARVGRIVFCTQRPSLLLNSGRRAVVPLVAG